ncbi:putative signal peptide protein [Puccinia sorghi]|uniref:Putative signal peptide protein n=1 Tax=Puccinia sorghi TaxID=27349 RepID=A0A0L6UHX1_9BASI|nr:putative signal peptide protein [Puccinia sorghi]
MKVRTLTLIFSLLINQHLTEYYYPKIIRKGPSCQRWPQMLNWRSKNLTTHWHWKKRSGITGSIWRRRKQLKLQVHIGKTYDLINQCVLSGKRTEEIERLANLFK